MTKKFIKAAAPILGAALPLLALAQPNIPNSPINSINDVIGTGGIFCDIFRYLFALLIILAVIFVIVAAFKYLTAAGDPEKVKSANHQLIYAAVAIIVALVARAIPSIVSTLIGGGTLASC